MVKKNVGVLIVIYPSDMILKKKRNHLHYNTILHIYNNLN